MLEKVKIALRITHTYLDSDILSTIEAARAELIRSGVSDEVANSDLDIVELCIKTYCQYVYASDSKTSEGFFKSFQYQLDNLRKSTIVV